MSEKTAVIICAAGAGSRFKTKRKKQFSDVAGRAVFLRSIEMFANRRDIEQVLLAIPEEDSELVKLKWDASLEFFNVQVYFGGKERFETVQKALKLIKNDISLIAVHDAVRCCVKKEWIDKCFEKAKQTGAAILARPVTTTIKQVENHIITRTVDRTNLWHAQTPQVFKTEILKKAYANLKNLDKAKISDDAQLIEAVGGKVSIVRTDSSNIKITERVDIPIAEAILKSRQKEAKRPLGPYQEAQW